MHNIIPVEVKSNKEHSAVFSGKFRRKFNGTLHTPAVLHPKDLKTWNGILHLPLYMTPLIAEIPQKHPLLAISTTWQNAFVQCWKAIPPEANVICPQRRRDLACGQAALDILVSGSDSQS